MKKAKVFLTCIVAGLFLLSSCGNSDTKEVTIEEAQKRTIVEVVSANGKIQPETDVKITAEVSGKITKIHVKEGDVVKTGDLLLTINPDLLESSVTRARASANNAKANEANSRARLAQVQAQFVNAEKTYQRSKTLFGQDVLSVAEMDQAEATYQTALADKTAAEETVKGAEYGVKSAYATQKEASDNLKRTTIFAESDGVITALQVEEGETVLGTIQMAGTELMRVSKLESMEVDVEVNESDIVRVALGDTADVEVDAYLDKTFKGLVTEIANAANNATSMMSTDQVTNFSVKIRILPSSYQDILAKNEGMQSPFRTGMSATVDIKTETKSNVLSIPIEAVTTRLDTSSQEMSFTERREHEKKLEKLDLEPSEVVFLNNSGRSKIVSVKTGVQDNQFIEVLSGLNEGDVVITGPYRTVSKSLNHDDEVSEKKQDSDDEDQE